MTKRTESMAERIFYSLEKPESLSSQVIELAKKGRSDGLLALIDDVDEMSEAEDSGVAGNMLVYGLRLVTDGTDPDVIRMLLDRQRDRTLRVLYSGWNVWKPLMKIIGRGEYSFEQMKLYADIQCDERFETNDSRREGLRDFIGTVETVWDPSRRKKLFHSLPLSFTEHPLTRVNLQTALHLAELPEMESVLESQYLRYADRVSSLCSIVYEGVRGVQSGTNPEILYDLLMTFAETSVSREGGGK